MKIIALGDIHGRSIWKDIVLKEENADKIVFIGDYFDTHTGGYSGNRQIENFKDILEFKRQNPDKVVLLFGNHDFHYIRGIGENYSGYQAGYAIDIGELIHNAIKDGLVQMCFVHDKYVFTHAGITKTWAAANDIDTNNLEESVNDLFKYKPYCFKFTSGEFYSNTGDDITQTPIWVRPSSLLQDIINDVICVVGHTTQKTIMIYNHIILIDTLGTSEEYLVIENGVASKRK